MLWSLDTLLPRITDHNYFCVSPAHSRTLFTICNCLAQVAGLPRDLSLPNVSCKMGVCQSSPRSHHVSSTIDNSGGCGRSSCGACVLCDFNDFQLYWPTPYLGGIHSKWRVHELSLSIIQSTSSNTLTWKTARGRHAPLRNLQWRQLSTLRR